MLRFGSLKTRIVVLTTIPLSALLVVFLAITNDIGTGTIKHGVQSSLADAGAVFVNLLTTRQNELLTMATVTAKDPRFFATFSVPTDERGEEFGPTMKGVAREFLLITGADFIEIFDAAGKPIAIADQDLQLELGDPALGSGGIRAAQGGRAVTDVYQSGSHLAVAAVVPVYLNDRLEAVLRIGRLLDTQFADQVQRLTSARICLARGGREFVSTFPESATQDAHLALQHSERPESALGPSGFAMSEASTMRHGETDYLMVSVKVSGVDGADGLVAFLGRELHHELAPVLSLETKMAALGAVALAVTFSASWLLASGITRPLSSIVRAAAQVGRGDYDHPLEISGSDEVAFLGKRFIEMRASLQSYVEHLRNIDKMKSNFIALAGHELKTPLTIISGFNQLIGGGVLGDLPDDVKETSAVIQEHLTDLNQLVQNMLDMSALDQGIYDFGFETADLREIAKVEIAARAPRMKGRHLSIDAALPDSPVRARVDSGRIAQAFAHLLDNAIRFTPDGGRITVALRREGDRVLWSVRDTGIGIPAGEFDWIFDKVYEVGDILRHSSVKNQFGSQGFGLGLALCKAIVTGHGGEIRVTSTLGRGSEFTIVLQAAAPVPAPGPERELAEV
jgi:signal transduction histidine kinase